MSATNIEWAERVWNPVTGCSFGCEFCYARKFANRMKFNPNPLVREKYKNGFKPTVHHNLFNEPATWRKPSRVFVTSMGDLFDPAVSFSDLHRLFKVMQIYGAHKYIILTKQPKRMKDFVHEFISANGLDAMPDNIWMGVSASNQQETDDRLRILIKTPVRVKIISLEPLTGPVSLFEPVPVWKNKIMQFLFPKEIYFIHHLSWVILGGMTGHNAKPMHPHWVTRIRNQCLYHGVPLFFKSWGAYYTKWVDTIQGKVVFRYFKTYKEWTDKLWVSKGDKLVSPLGKYPTYGKEIRESDYPLAIMSPVKPGDHNRHIDNYLFAQFPK